MRRVITFICVFSVLVFVLCVPAFADASHFSVKDVYVYDAYSNVWVENSDFWWGPTTGDLLSWKPSAVTAQGGIRFTLVPAGYVMVESGYYYNFNISFTGLVQQSSSLANDHSFSLTFTLSDGTNKTLRPYSSGLFSDADSSKYRWESYFSLYVGDGTPVRVTGITFETDYSGDTNGSYRIKVNASVSTEPTPELKQHLEIMQKLQEIFSGLSDEIQEQTEELTNGWDNTGDEPADVGGAADDLGQAESDALGGKSDAEIQQEVNNALSGEGLPDFETSFVVADLFDRLLWSFGTGYQSLLILSLTLGLAAFLIGRSWSKGV